MGKKACAIALYVILGEPEELREKPSKIEKENSS